MAKRKNTKRNTRAQRATPSPIAVLATWWAKNARWFAPAVIGFADVAMMCWTWGAWADVIVDFGRELYIPWRLTEGDALYRDLAHFNGPLSPYVNSLWFRLFGVSLRVLALVNFALLGLLLALLYNLLSQIGSRTSALLSGLLFVAVFAFSVLGYNFNYICPYAHEMTHGLLLSLAAIFFVGRYVRSGRLLDVALCGFFVGLVFLTKPEIFVAVLPATAAGIWLAHRSRGHDAARFTSTAAAFLGPMLIPAVAAVALLSLAMPAPDAVAGMLGGFRWIFAPEVTMSPFYRRMRGTYELPLTCLRILAYSVGYVLLLGLPAILGAWWRPGGRSRLLGALVVFASIAAASWPFLPQIIALSLLPLPLVVLAALGALALRYVRQDNSAGRCQLVLPTTLVLFSLLLTAKVLLNVRVDNYGFVLGLPATLLAVVVLWDWLPQAIGRFGSAAAWLRAGFLAILVMLAYAFLHAQTLALSQRTFCVGIGGDAIWWNDRGREVNRALEEIATEIPPDGTFAVVPEGIMLNYLTRRRNPTGYVSYMPLETTLFGEDRMLEGFQRDPPDAVLRLTRKLQVYDVKPFGEGYARRLNDWLLAHYLPVERTATNGAQFQIVIYKRRDAVNMRNEARAPLPAGVDGP